MNRIDEKQREELMQMFEGVSAASSKESCAAELAKLPLHPEQSTDAFVLHHPEAKYFNV
jgi:cobalamin-dependent methionine synthase I